MIAPRGFAGFAPRTVPAIRERIANGVVRAANPMATMESRA